MMPSVCSWSWRKLLTIREMAGEFIQYKVGIGENILHMWLDNWHLDGVLHTWYGQQIVYDARSKVEAKLSSVLIGKEWCWLPARSDDMVSGQSKLDLVKIGDEDQPCWVVCKKGTYTCSEMWEAMRVKTTTSKLVESSLVSYGYT